MGEESAMTLLVFVAGWLCGVITLGIGFRLRGSSSVSAEHTRLPRPVQEARRPPLKALEEQTRDIARHVGIRLPQRESPERGVPKPAVTGMNRPHYGMPRPAPPEEVGEEVA